MLAAGIAQFLLGIWAVPPIVPTSALDINGVAITIGSTVKLVGTVVGLNITDPHFDGIAVQALHPNGNGPLVGETFFLDPLQLIVGS